MSKIIDPNSPEERKSVEQTLADLFDGGEKTLSEHDKTQLELLQKQNPKAYAIARVNEIRRRLSKVMCEIVAHPKLLPNVDLLDWLRDRAKDKGLKYEMIEDKQQAGIVHTFIWDPKVERMDLRPWMGPKDGATNYTYLGWVEKNTEPTPDRGE